MIVKFLNLIFSDLSLTGVSRVQCSSVGDLCVLEIVS